MVTVGFSRNTDTAAAVREALRETGSASTAGWFLVMSGRRHAGNDVLAALRSHAPDVPVYGGSCVGAICSSHSGYTGYEIAMAAFPPELSPPEVCIADPLESNEQAAGEIIGDWLVEKSVNQAMLMYDVTRSGGGINVGTFLLDGIYSRLGEAREEPLLFGAGLLGDFPLTESHAYVGDEVRKNVAVAVAIPKRLQARVRVMHGCAPVSGVMRVTRAEGARIHELDGEPAAHVLKRLSGNDELTLAFSVLLGRRSGDPLAPLRETEFINRLIIDVDTDDGSVGLFETDIQTGDDVQVMVRDNQQLIESVEAGVAQSLADLGGSEPVLAMYVDCAGRASVFTGSEEEEAEKLMSTLDMRCPLFGFYAGREIAPFAGRSRPLDWTGVFVTFTEAPT